MGRIALPLPGNGTDGVSTRALLTLRGQLLPATIGKLPAVSYGVTGATAASYDWNEMMKSSLPVVFGFVLTFAFLLLLASFRSLVIAAKAVVLNLLSVAAAYGVVVAVFQFGWGTNILGFTSNARWRPGCRCSCSSSCSGCRWTTTCSSSAASGRRMTAGCAPRTRSRTASRPRRER